MQREAAETADFDALSLRERIAHDLEYLLQRELHILGWQVLLLRSNDLDEFRFRHEFASTHAVKAVVASVTIRADLFLQQIAQARA